MKKVFFISVLLVLSIYKLYAQTYSQEIVLDNDNLITYTDSILGIIISHPMGSECECYTKEAFLYIKLDLGDNYNFGDNAFSVSFNTIVIVGNSSASPNPIPVREFSMAIDETTPEAIKVIDVTSDYFNNILSYRAYWYSYSASGLVEDSVRFTVQVVEKLQCDPEPSISCILRFLPHLFYWLQVHTQRLGLAVVPVTTLCWY